TAAGREPSTSGLMTALYLAAQGQPLACLLLHDALRTDAQATVDYFRRAGKQLVVLSGDDDALTRGVAATLGIEDASGGCLPAALGWLNPWLSGAGMALSSAVVVANALRLRRA